MKKRELRELVDEVIKASYRKELRDSEGRAVSIRAICLMTGMHRETLYKVRDGALYKSGLPYTMTVEQANTLCELLGWELRIVKFPEGLRG